jgi:hypothetical protein
VATTPSRHVRNQSSVMCPHMSDEQIQHYISAKAKNWKSFSVFIHMVPWILLKYHVLNVTTLKTIW